MSVSEILVLAGSGIAAGSALWFATDPSLSIALKALSHRCKTQAMARKKGIGVVRSGSVRAVKMFAAGVEGRFRRSRDRRARANERGRCLDELPELIDVVALGLSAGISFDAALEIYCTRYQTMLAGLMGDAMRSWRLGMATRREALRSVAAHLQVGALSTFVETVAESLDFGAPLAKTLTEQAESVRLARRMAVEEQIEKAPVKMLIPTGTLVLPAMLLAILGPILASLASLTG